MTTIYPLLMYVHLLAVLVWVGGMFFAYVCLRPVAAAQLQPPQRLALWAGVFGRFFPWVWAAVLLILATGLTMLLAIGMARAPLYLHVMLLCGLVMMGVYAQVYFGPYAQLGRAVAAADWPTAGAALNRIRQRVGFNLLLGLVTVSVAKLGPNFAG